MRIWIALEIMFPSDETRRFLEDRHAETVTYCAELFIDVTTHVLLESELMTIIRLELNMIIGQTLLKIITHL